LTYLLNKVFIYINKTAFGIFVKGVSSTRNKNKSVLISLPFYEFSTYLSLLKRL